jgi:hypothetical protein
VAETVKLTRLERLTELLTKKEIELAHIRKQMEKIRPNVASAEKGKRQAAETMILSSLG